MTFFYFQKNMPNEINAVNRTDSSPYQKKATKIKAFQAALEVKVWAANGACRQVELLT